MNSQRFSYVSSFFNSAYVEKLERIRIPVAVDSTQQEALAVLKKLKVCFFIERCQVCTESLCFFFLAFVHFNA